MRKLNTLILSGCERLTDIGLSAILVRLRMYIAALDKPCPPPILPLPEGHNQDTYYFFGRERSNE